MADQGPFDMTATDSKDDPEWTTGDYEVITSDGIRFRVPSYYLLAAS